MQVSLLERKDQIGRLDFDAGDGVVVLLRTCPPSPGSPRRCDYPYLCGTCSEAIRGEALRWLRGLADDHFGFSLEELLASGVHVPEIRILWRDPEGVLIYRDDLLQLVH